MSATPLTSEELVKRIQGKIGEQNEVIREQQVQIQEQQQQISDLEAKISQLEAKVGELQTAENERNELFSKLAELVD